jgi:hypothetical protein
LNLADGLLGQGLNTIVLLTANTPSKRLDPALTRAGRCIATVEFERFAAPAVRRWLGDPQAAIPEQGLTLAEMYEMSGALARYGDTTEAPTRVGAYL